MLKSLRNGATAIGVTGAALFLGVGVAAADVTVTPNSNLTAGQTITVSYTGLVPGQLGFVYECWETDTTKPKFSFAADCYTYSQNTFVIGANGSGTFQYSALLAETDQVNEEYACGRETPGTEGTLPPANVRSTCYIRVNDTSPGNNASDQFTPITFAYGQPPIPEAPYSALLPLGALAVLGGGYAVLRNRRSAAAA